jgi:uncharacterized protein (TIGR02217 family)
VLVFDLNESVGTQVTLKFNTSIVRTSAGIEQRIVNWDRGQLQFDLSKEILYQSDLVELQQFHEAVRGSRDAFLFKDWSDYKVGAGQGVLAEYYPGYYRAYKKYICGGQTILRPILHFDPDTVSIEPSGLNWGFAGVAGDLIFWGDNPEPILSWTGEFFVPVRFESDELEYKRERGGGSGEVFYSVPKLTLIEVEIEDGALFPVSANEAIEGIEDSIADLLPVDVSIVPAFSTNIKTLDSKFDRRDEENPMSIAKWKLGAREILTEAEMSFLISLFRVARGMGSRFRIKDSSGYKNLDFENVPEKMFWVRFDSDELTYRSEQEFFSCPNIDLRELIFDYPSLEIMTDMEWDRTQGAPINFNIEKPIEAVDWLRVSAVLKTIRAAHCTATIEGIVYASSSSESVDRQLSGLTPIVVTMTPTTPSSNLPTFAMRSIEYTIVWSGLKIAE